MVDSTINQPHRQKPRRHTTVQLYKVIGYSHHTPQTTHTQSTEYRHNRQTDRQTGTLAGTHTLIILINKQ